MTIHASKGLEFPHVFLPGWEDGMMPGHSAQFNHEDLEEERRLGYVAITRAMESCTISHARQRMLYGKTQYSSPSKFISELDENCCNVSGMNTLESGHNQFRSARSASNFAPPDKGGTGGSRKTTVGEAQALAFNKPAPSSRQEAVFGITENNADYAISERVRHVEWGEGTIINISGDVLSIAFSGKGIKKVVASIAPLDKI